jgi:hypothetical protein
MFGTLSLGGLLNPQAFSMGKMQDYAFDDVPYGYSGELFIWTPNLDAPYTMEVASSSGDLSFDDATGVVSPSTPFGSEQTRWIILEAWGSGGTPYVSIKITFTSLYGASPSFSVGAPTAQLEGDSGITFFSFPVTLFNHGTGTNSIDWTVTGTGPNPANAADFVGDVLPSGTLDFASDGTQFALIGVKGDTLVEPDEGFTVTLWNPTNGASIASATASTTILTDDTIYAPVPAPVLTGNPALFASLDPADLSSITLDGAGNVSSIAGVDGTTRSYSAASANGSAYPSLPVIDGIRMMEFTEALQNYLTRSDSSGVSTHSSDGRCTIVAIFERADASTNTLAITNIGAAAQNSLTSQLSVLATTGGYLTRKAGPSSQTTLTQGAQDQNRHCLISVMTNNVSSPVGYLDGGSGTTGAAANWPVTLDNTKIGARTASGALGTFGSWRLCRWLLYDAVLNATQAEQIAAWAASNYGTPNV